MAEDWMKILNNKELKAEADKMMREGTMPSLEELLDTIRQTRDKYSEPIKRARKLGKTDAEKREDAANGTPEAMPKPNPGALKPLG